MVTGARVTWRPRSRARMVGPGLRALLLAVVLLGVLGGTLSGAAAADAALPALGELAAGRGLLFGAQVRERWSTRRASRSRTCTSAED